MPRPAAPAALLLLLTVGGCSLSTVEASDSLGRAAEASATATPSPLKPPVPSAPTLEFAAALAAKFDIAPKTAKAGLLNIRFHTTANHNLEIVGPGHSEPLHWGFEGAGAATDLTYSVDLPPGTYTYYCDVPGHREIGMEGTFRLT